MHRFRSAKAAWAWSLLLLAGCASTPRVELHPVSNPIPPCPSGVYDISAVATAPVAIFQAPPRYPYVFRSAGITGSCKIVFVVRTDGTVGDAWIAEATDLRFGEAAQEVVLQWRFRPARVNDEPVNCMMMVPIRFDFSEH